MKIFIIEDVESLTGNYHEGGGLVIVAANEDEARLMVKGLKQTHLTEEEWKSAIIHELKGNPKPDYYIFPDAGCC